MLSYKIPDKKTYVNGKQSTKRPNTCEFYNSASESLCEILLYGKIGSLQIIIWVVQVFGVYSLYNSSLIGYITMLVPPEHFALVEEGIYRSSRVDGINIPFLKSLELKSIVWINEEKPPRAVRQYMEENNVQLHHIVNSSILQEEEGGEGANGNIITNDNTSITASNNDNNKTINTFSNNNVKFQEWMILRPSIISKAFMIMLNKENHNCLIMDTSDVIIGILRCILLWSYSSIFNEYKLFARRMSYKVEIFLELINVELIPHIEDTEDVKVPIIYQRTESVSSDSSTSTRSTSNMNIASDDQSSTNSLAIPIGSSNKEQSTTESMDRLSISTSPQVPMNLLKMAEKKHKDRKKNQLPNALDSFNRTRESHKKSLKWTMYQPRTDRTQVLRGGCSGNIPLPTTISVQIPQERLLPQWFIHLREKLQ